MCITCPKSLTNNIISRIITCTFEPCIWFVIETATNTLIVSRSVCWEIIISCRCTIICPSPRDVIIRAHVQEKSPTRTSNIICDPEEQKLFLYWIERIGIFNYQYCLKRVYSDWFWKLGKEAFIWAQKVDEYWYPVGTNSLA